MSDVVSFAEIDGQHLELLAARTLLQTSSVLGDLTTVVSNLATITFDSKVLSSNSASSGPAPAPSGG